jgi:hypothetical protein
MKCVLVLGVNMDNFRSVEDYTLSHTSVVPLVLKTVESCPGEVIRDALIEAQGKTGEAIAVLSDEGTEIRRGVKLYNKTDSVIHLNDILHKMDLVLKKELSVDVIWQGFTKHTTDTIQQLKLSTFAHLIPPKQRQKKRLRGEIKIIEWGQKVIRYLKSGKATDQEKEKLSWILEYEFILNAYQEMAHIFDAIVSEVRKKGYYRNISQNIEQHWPSDELTERAQSFLKKALKVLKEEESKIPEGMSLLGSSEIIESTFGKFKQLAKGHSSGGLTSLVLSLCAMVGQHCEDFIKTAMEQTSIKDVKEWVKNNLGTTFWSRRRKDLGDNDDCSHQDNSWLNEDYLDSDEYFEEAFG